MNYFKKSDDVKANIWKANLIVLIFVVAHAVTCLLTHNTSFGDGFLLTCLTIAMVFSLIKFYEIPFDVFLGLALLSCFAGFYLGTVGAKFLNSVVPHWGVWVNVLTTSVITELLGLIIILLLRRNWKKD